MLNYRRVSIVLFTFIYYILVYTKGCMWHILEVILHFDMRKTRTESKDRTAPQVNFFQKIEKQLKEPSWKGHRFFKRNAAIIQGIWQYLLKKFVQKMHFPKIMSIPFQTVVPWHCWHGNASCHLANTW